MRTTLDIDEDVLAAAKSLAKSRRSTAGEVISELAAQAIAQLRLQLAEPSHEFWPDDIS